MLGGIEEQLGGKNGFTWDIRSQLPVVDLSEVKMGLVGIYDLSFQLLIYPRHSSNFLVLTCANGF